MSCQCHQVGGSFVAEDPDCIVHGDDAPKEPRGLTRDVIEVLWLKARLDMMREFYTTDTGRELDTRTSYRDFAWLLQKYIRREIDV